jgi:hypothetical protein
MGGGHIINYIRIGNLYENPNRSTQKRKYLRRRESVLDYLDVQEIKSCMTKTEDIHDKYSTIQERN